ncbi:SMI1/KNR4 family protein [Blastopirellula marina]|uniref:SMI1/KNR4 family protein n=1 Tax=Blastopirellula marina TaxID=124 RepID=A0A2S8F1E9_9BACT|nr:MULTISPECIES: SMI1/KNR4 family protein [Pirellulaceae]PQO25998.1 SMI1/KNR4 family protein [Blastopirellula marina]RCS44356.1 SMI1/KNR4 family protein [Bremerella cremea]
MKTTKALAPPSAPRISKLQDHFEIEFPDDYLTFLKENNGGVPDLNVFSMRGYDFVVERFLPILDDPRQDNEHGWYDISVVTSQLDCRLIDDEDSTGMNVLPIAALFGGDFVCLDYRESASPCVSVWKHETSDEFSPDLITVANSFTSFLSMFVKAALE